MKKWHVYSGLFLSIFITLHLFNHLLSLGGPALHIQFMDQIRKLYRQPIIEPALLLFAIIQSITGWRLTLKKGFRQKNKFHRYQVYAGIYLSIFLIIHPLAILVGRHYFHVDTNFYFGAMVVNYWPQAFFYTPYYFLGSLAYFVHIGSTVQIYRIKRKGPQVSSLPAYSFYVIGAIVSLLILLGLTNFFLGYSFPEIYEQLMT